MKTLKLFSLFVGLILSGSGTFAVRGQNTIDEAIRQVKSITNPDPFKQNELRAEEAKKIIMARIRTTNPNLTDPPEFKALNDEMDLLRNGDGAKGRMPAGGEQMLNWVWDKRAGRCAEQVDMMKKILGGAGVEVTVITAGNHVFPVVNMEKGARLDIPWSWGPHAIAPDTWLGKTLRPEESWTEPLHFDSGRKSAGSQVEMTTFELLELIDKYRNRVDSNCNFAMTGMKTRTYNYRELLTQYLKIPKEYRGNLTYRPKEEFALEAGKDELNQLRGLIEKMNKNDADEVRRVHAAVSDLDGRFGQMGRCYEEAELFRKEIQKTFKLLPKLKTDATLGISDTGSDEVPDDIAANTGEVKVIQYFVFLLTNASNGLYVGSEDSLKGRTSCSFEGGGINCKSSDIITYKRLSAPFASQEEAQTELCKSITESRIFPLGVGLKGRWQGGSNWYGLWNASIDGCPK